MNDVVSVVDRALDLGLAGEERWFRADVCRGIELRDGKPQIDREAGIIHGYAVITKGPALGHNMTIDDTTLAQVVALGNRAKLGIKSRFDHPNASNTSMGTFIGRTKNFRRAGDRVLADLHLSEAAKDAPQGDLHTYVMGLAEHDPQAFGASIVFEGKSEFVLNEDGTRATDEQGKPLPALARVERLLASDVVDEPAANPGGLFSAEQSLASKLTAFLTRWAQHDLLPQLSAMVATHKEDAMSDQKEPITGAQLDAARAEGKSEGIAAERGRVASINRAFASVWGEQPPASETKVRDGLVELGTSAADAETAFKTRKLMQLTEAAPASAGGGHDQAAETPKTDLSKLPLEDRCKAEWETNVNGVREEFGALSTYVAFMQAEAKGQVKILKK